MFRSIVVGVVSALLIILIALYLSVSTAHADEMAIGRLPEKTHLVIDDDKGSPVPDAMLPVGYHRLPDGGISTPHGLIISPDGKLLAPQGVSLEGYSQREQDGAILTPEGFAIRPVPVQEEKPVAQEKPEQPTSVDIAALLPVADDPKPDRADPQQPSNSKEEKSDKSAPSRGGQELQIPKDARKRNDLSFLKGCWETNDIVLYSNVEEANPVPRRSRATLCFGNSGGGGIIYHNEGCDAAVQAHFSGQSMLIHAKRSSLCKRDNRYIAVRTFTCDGEGASTRCSVLAKGTKNSHSSVMHFRRK